MYDVKNLIPHSGVMVLVDEVVFVDDVSIITKSVIKNSPFINDGKFLSFQLIEIMAQSLGVYKSCNDKTSANDVAFLIGCRKFEILKPFLEIGDEILIDAKLSIQDESGFGVYDCKCYLDKILVAKASISVFNPNKEKLAEIKNA
ncbi:thioester dehydrase [Campylobacter sp. FMV-PI01]|uniref:Thioester dehydrase n=1 Tax=Campylobacter portucalensis TaxID=2608384 RepID=A0A6L5WHN6_9BACT|nr:thioester dehydrase [Campylobacter portucalensis]MSN96700.1 thioester dehydrase [Campylobacter portucalensis]